MKIAIAKGHTLRGKGTGAVGIKSETGLNRPLGDKVIDKLKRLGQEVVECVIDESNSDLAYRVNKANKANVDLYVEIHFNYFNGSASGTEVHTLKSGLKANEYAQRVVNEIAKLGYKNRGVKHSDFYVLRHTSMEAILIECCFIDNAEDMNRYNVEAMANAIVLGLVGSLPEESKPRPQQNIQYGTITATELNVRAGRGTGYDIWDTLKSGTRVELGSLENGWYLIYYNGGKASGYVSAKYIRKD